jgi:hypothetical protein
VSELWFRTHAVEPQGRVPGEGAEAEDHPRVREQFQLAGGVGEAVVAFGGCRLVLWWGAADGGGDPDSREPEPVVPALRDRLVRKSCPMEGCEEEVSGTVAGKDPARTVRAVGRRCEPEDYYLRVRVSETGYGTTPVSFVSVGGLFRVGYLFAPLDQSRAVAAGDDLTLQVGELCGFSRSLGSVAVQL